MRIKRSTSFKKNALSSIKNWIVDNKFILLIILLNILLHLPRTSHMQGNDAYTVVWMAKAMSKGWYEAWTINPLSLFGYYPFSFYPAGGIFILSLLFRTGLDVDHAVYIYSFIFMILGIISSYLLGKILFKEDTKMSYWFVLFFTLSPLFIDYTKWTCTLRGPFLSILPLALYYMIKFLETRNLKNFLLTIFSSIVLLSMHALLIGFSIYLATTIIVLVLFKLKNRGFLIKMKEFFTKKRASLLIILSIYLSLFILSTVVFGFKGWVVNYMTGETALVQNLEENIFFKISLIIYTYIFYGFGFTTVLFIFGFFLQFDKFSNKNIKVIHLSFFIITGFFASLIFPFVDYAPLLILPWICFYSTKFIQYLNNKINNRKLFWFISIWIIFLIYIQRIGLTFMSTVLLILLSVGSLILIIISYLEITKFSKNNFHILTKLGLVIVFGIVLSSTVCTSLNDQTSNYPNYNLSEDEIIIANYLQANNINNNIIVSYNIRVGRRIQAIGFQPVILTENPAAMLYYHYLNVTEEYIKNTSSFSFNYIFEYGKFLETNITPWNLERYYLYSQVLKLDLRKVNDYSIAISEYNIGYILLSSNPEDNVPTGDFSSNLFDSIIETGLVEITTTHLILYKLAPP